MNLKVKRPETFSFLDSATLTNSFAWLPQFLSLICLMKLVRRREPFFSVVEDGAQQLARELAETALHRLGARTAVITPPPAGPLILPWATTQLDTTVMIHGSQFSFVGTPIGNWWQPGGAFHTFVQSNFRPNLYSRPDFYTWSGGWSDHARKLAALDLRNWTHARGLRDIDIIAHSHGGNVAMLASHLGVEIKTLILLSCPAHPTYYLPHFPRVKHVVSYQIKLDWVVLADRGNTHLITRKSATKFKVNGL